jgi:hypothetical protein
LKHVLIIPDVSFRDVAGAMSGATPSRRMPR